MKIFLIEDHDEALKVWRKCHVRGLDLVHIDAHMDFELQRARPVEDIVKEAASVNELKEGLEYTLSFLHYERDFNKQTHVGNYTYPAIREGIVRDFYWVVPGDGAEFEKRSKELTGYLKRIMEDAGGKSAIHRPSRDTISSEFFGRRIVICTLDSLPEFTGKVLLDIDADFLVIDSMSKADATKDIGSRRPWISPLDLAVTLNNKVPRRAVTTIAYSVNGGWTPMEYKTLADEMAYRICPSKYRRHFARKAKAAEYFKLFKNTGSREYYRKAAKIDPGYRAGDNNYGPLYLAAGEVARAEKEFKRILKADRGNPAALSGLGSVAMRRRKYREARRYLNSALLGCGESGGIFKPVRLEALLELSMAEMKLKNPAGAKKYLLQCRKLAPLESKSAYYLGAIYEEEGRYSRAARCYKDAVRLGWYGIEPLERLIKICGKLTEKDDIIRCVAARYEIFKKGIAKARSAGLRKRLLALEARIKREDKAYAGH